MRIEGCDRKGTYRVCCRDVLRKEIRYKNGRNKLLTAKVWETVLQSPYSVDFTENQARQLIEEDLLARKMACLPTWVLR